MRGILTTVGVISNRVPDPPISTFERPYLGYNIPEVTVCLVSTDPTSSGRAFDLKGQEIQRWQTTSAVREAEGEDENEVSKTIRDTADVAGRQGAGRRGRKT